MEDKYLWLENIQDEKSISWVMEKNAESIKKLSSHPLFHEIKNTVEKIYASKDKIPYVQIEGDYVYNLWNDEMHVQGIYRRTKIEDYLKENTIWEIILDLDKLSKEENEKWVFADFKLNNDESRALVFLSPGGSDANVMRELDLKSKEFLKDGFILPEAKGDAHWIDDNTLWLARTFGPDSITESGYASTLREWKRGQPLTSAKIIFEINKEKMMVYSKEVKTTEKSYFFLGQLNDFYNIEEKKLINGTWKELNLPTMVEDFGVVCNHYVVLLKQDWNNFKLGDVLAYNLDTDESKKIFSATNNESIYSIKRSLDGFYAIVDEDVKGSLYWFSLGKNGVWSKVKIDLPKNGSLDNLETDYRSNKFFISFSSFNQPSTYYYGDGKKIIGIAKTAPSFFNHKEVIVEQVFATSLDGTKIPYFVVYKQGTSFNGINPTILYGYGGFEVSMKPYFSNGNGFSWIDRGGVYALANIRGGGEYGPAWHQVALKENRHKSYEDFFAVAEDLIERKITSSKHLGAMGGSNGGLLMGVCYTQRPDLFKAINCMVPLLDMHRYHKLLAGSSWIAEYGDPDNEIDGAYIKSISPYQNIKEMVNYPDIFLNTSTKDDRVHPGHARKFAAKLSEYGHSVYYYENMQGGHAGASNYDEMAFLHALEMCFFWSQLR